MYSLEGIRYRICNPDYQNEPNTEVLKKLINKIQAAIAGDLYLQNFLATERTIKIKKTCVMKT